MQVYSWTTLVLRAHCVVMSSSLCCNHSVLYYTRVCHITVLYCYYATTSSSAAWPACLCHASCSGLSHCVFLPRFQVCEEPLQRLVCQVAAAAAAAAAAQLWAQRSVTSMGKLYIFQLCNRVLPTLGAFFYDMKGCRPVHQPHPHWQWIMAPLYSSVVCQVVYWFCVCWYLVSS